MNWQEPNHDRLYYSIQRKANTYKTMADEYSVPYVIAVFSEFTAAVNLDELGQCLFDKEFGLFASYPVISGVLFFEERFGRYAFTYMPNPNPVKRIDVLSGEF